MKLTDLFEQAKKPQFLNSVIADIKSLEGDLWEKDLEVPEIIEILNQKLEMYLIRFEETFANGESEYSRVGLSGGEFSSSGWVTVGITHDADEVLNGETNVYFSEFLDLCAALIGHELTHREQVLKSLKNFVNIPDTDDRTKYLSDHREIEAYAVQAALELLPQLGKVETLSKLSNLESLSIWSNVVKMYAHTFDNDSPILKKFVKKLYELLHENEED